jgi:quercetin dioxygenase-like cupin family protein
MQTVELRAVESGGYGLRTVFQSAGGKTRLIEGVLAPEGEIGPHTHPSGEDCALVLSGVLTYWVSNSETISVSPGEVVFDWQQVIHGYRNDSSEPVHLLIFSTPGNNGLEYPGDGDATVRHLPGAERKLTSAEGERQVCSEYSCFSFVTVGEAYADCGGSLVVFVDSGEKRAYVFDREPVRLLPTRDKRLLRYTAQS